jgi:hypothetical protein
MYTLYVEIDPSVTDRVANCGELFLFIIAFSFSVTLFKVVFISFSALYTGSNKDHKVS